MDIESGSPLKTVIDELSQKTGTSIHYEEQFPAENAVYHASDVAIIKAFLVQKDNAQILGADINNINTWLFVRWTKVNGEYYVRKVSMTDTCGVLDLSGLTYLNYLECYESQLKTVNVSGCYRLTSLSCTDSKVEKLILTGCKALVKINCEYNYLDLDEIMEDIRLIEAREGASVSYKNQYINANKAVYNQKEISVLETFAQTEENRELLGWDLERPGEWRGISWSISGNEYRVRAINFEYLEISGILNLCDFKKLEILNCFGTMITQVVLPIGMNEIDEAAFMNCKKLETITISESITRINRKAFMGCDHLQEILLPESLIEIEDSAFAGCNSLQSVVFEKNVNVFSNRAFADCNELKMVLFKGNAPSITGVDLFGEVHNDFILYYYHSALGWAAKPWTAFHCIALGKLLTSH